MPSRHADDSDDEVFYQARIDPNQELHPFRPFNLTQTQASAYSSTFQDMRRRRRRAVNDPDLEESSDGDSGGLTSSQNSAPSTQKSVCNETNPFAALEAFFEREHQDYGPKHGEEVQMETIGCDMDCDKTTSSTRELQNDQFISESQRQSPLTTSESAASVLKSTFPRTLDIPKEDESSSIPSHNQSPTASIKQFSYITSPCLMKVKEYKMTGRRLTGGKDSHLAKTHNNGAIHRMERPKRVGIVRAKHSIVGSIPEHWKARNLNTARCFSFKRNAKSRVVQPLPNIMTLKSAAAPKLSPEIKDKERQMKSSQISRIRGASSFVPSFLSGSNGVKESANLLEDRLSVAADIVEESSSPRNSRACSPVNFASPPPSKRRKIGFLSSRLQQIRNEVLGDTIRFQSGQYPFREKKSMFDINDPRSKAKSHMDVTIMENAEPFGPDEGNRKQLIFLSHVHEHVTITPDGPESASPSGCSVWLVFNEDQALQLHLQKGSSLRVYNAIAVALPSRNDWIFICSELCEPFPRHVLGPLGLPA